MSFPSEVTLVEVGPRDGLQNEKQAISTDDKRRLIALLIDAGSPIIECTSFVSPKWVPQLADARALMSTLSSKWQSGDRPEQPTAPRLTALVPNEKGLDLAIEAGVREIAIFTAASETFNQKNINCSIQQSLARFEPVMKKALATGMHVRGYISCVLGCPYEGTVTPQQVAPIARQLVDMGCYEISLGDTIGIGTALQAQQLFSVVSETVPIAQLAAHFHDTYGQALANIFAVLSLGVSTIDCAVGGLGGCPYAPGAAGNVASEDVVYLLNGMGIHTGIDLEKLADAGTFINTLLGRPPASRVAQALASRQSHQ